MHGLPPVRRHLVVPLDVPAAFDLFVRRLPEWWPLATRSVALENAASCHVEAWVGGRLFERARDGTESIWGTFRTLDEPGRAVFSWHPGLDPSAATEVEVRFTAMGESTRVELEHRDWERLGARASFVRGLFEGGWPGVLARFEARARGEDAMPEVVGAGCTVLARE